MSIFPDKNYIDDTALTATDPGTAELRVALSRMILAHQAPCGGKPTEDQLRAIMFQSGAAVTAILMAMRDACKAFAELQH